MQLSLMPMPVVSAVFVVLGLGVIVAIGRAAARWAPEHPDREGRAEVFDVAKLIGGILALFMIFVMTQCMNYYRAAEIAAAKEAGDILQLDRALSGVPAASSEPARLRLREYTRSLIEQEWPAMQRSRPSPGTEHALDGLQQAVGLVLNTEPGAAAFRNVQKNFDDVEDDRTARLGAAQGGVPPALWWTIEALGAMLAASLFQLRLDRRQFRSFAPYLASLLLLTAVLYMVDGPYGGSLHVEPDPLQRTLDRLTAP